MNLPTRITVTRIILIPIIVAVYLIPWDYSGYIAAAIYIIAAITDFLDGKIARKYNMVTTLGKFLDGIADKMLVSVSLLLILADNTIPHPWGVITMSLVFCRDLIIGCLRQVAAANGKVIAADMIGKIKATFQDVAIPLLFVVPHWLAVAGVGVFNLFDNGFSIPIALVILAFIVYAVSIVLTVVSGFTYIFKNKEVFKTE